MAKRVGRTPYWPDYLPYNKTERTLAIIVGKDLYLETGDHLEAHTFAEFVDILFSKNLMAFVESLTNELVFPWLFECVYSSSHKVLCSKKGTPTSVRLVSGKKSRWIVPASSWNTFIDDDFLKNQRALYTHVDAGVKPTPGSLGQTRMRLSWKSEHLPIISSCNVACQNFLYKHRIGGRCDVFHVGETFESALELDMASAYLAHLLSVPVGTSVHFARDDCSQFATYFCKCIVTIHHDLPLGPFPVKKKGSNIEYPTRKGFYQTYLWKEQIEDATAMGCTVIIQGGFGWDSLSSNFTSFARDMYQRKIHSPNDYIEEGDKQVIVSSIGQFGMKQTFYELVSDELAAEDDTCLVDNDGTPYNFFIQETHDYTRPSLLHIYAYDLMQCARTLFKIALPYAQQGRLIMTNYDAILVTEGDEPNTYREKHTIEAKMAEMGDLRWQRLTNVHILGKRSLKCDQKIITPGVTHESEVA